ncbi:2Fe-2S iron-sulfur cluster-binding protein [Paraburkholderia sp. BR14263]|uniref:2Fe-2S iron-sulfur cluster-binding protein n=1 Tax=unclassified Paraburkholderia TaxID=2615204 RepID=UPI0034CF2678
MLLDAALRSGVNIPLDCREGVCGTCQGRCESGSYTQDYVDEEALSPDDLAARKILSCQTRLQSDASFYFDFDSSLCGAGGKAVAHGPGFWHQAGIRNDGDPGSGRRRSRGTP